MDQCRGGPPLKGGPRLQTHPPLSTGQIKVSSRGGAWYSGGGAGDRPPPSRDHRAAKAVARSNRLPAIERGSGVRTASPPPAPCPIPRQSLHRAVVSGGAGGAGQRRGGGGGGWWGQDSGLADPQEKVGTASCGEEYTGDCPGPRKETTDGLDVTRGGGGGQAPRRTPSSWWLPHFGVPQQRGFLGRPPGGPA